MEELLKQLLDGQKQLSAEIKTIQEKMGTKVQQDENNRFIQALIHRTEELDAKFDGLLNNTANVESVKRIETKIDILTHRILAQDGEIQLLKQVK